MELFGHIEVDRKALGQILAKYDPDQSGEINFVEFLGMMAADDPQVQRDIKSHVVGFREAFALFDYDGTGFVTVDEFLKTWLGLGFEATYKQVEALMAESDTDGDGVRSEPNTPTPQPS